MQYPVLKANALLDDKPNNAKNGRLEPKITKRCGIRGRNRVKVHQITGLLKKILYC